MNMEQVYLRLHNEYVRMLPMQMGNNVTDHVSVLRTHCYLKVRLSCLRTNHFMLILQE